MINADNVELPLTNIIDVSNMCVSVITSDLPFGEYCILVVDRIDKT